MKLHFGRFTSKKYKITLRNNSEESFKEERTRTTSDSVTNPV